MSAVALSGRAGADATLSVSDLSVSIERHGRRARVVDGVSFELPTGGSFGIVGESGSGKSLTLRALMALLPPGVRVESGRAVLGGVELPLAGRHAHVARRGRVSMIFQDPLGALDPVHTVGNQVAEVPRRVLHQSARASRGRALELLGLVGLPEPARRAEAYPHQLSGGMRQRVLIAMALASDPVVLLCDEPTTALDVTVQAQVLELLDDLRRRLGLSVVFVSHDLAVVRQVCERTGVMYAGRLLETGATADLLDTPAHPYTAALLGAVVDLDDPLGAPRPIPGELPDPTDPPPGCPFHPRCGVGSEDCRSIEPRLRPPGEVAAQADEPALSGAPAAALALYAAPALSAAPATVAHAAEPALSAAPAAAEPALSGAPAAAERPTWRPGQLTACIHPERIQALLHAT